MAINGGIFIRIFIQCRFTSFEVLLGKSPTGCKGNIHVILEILTKLNNVRPTGCCESFGLVLASRSVSAQ